MDTIKPYAKAIAAFLAPAAGSILVAVTEASAGGVTITTGEWIGAACLAIVTAGGVYAIPNAPARSEGKRAA